MNKKIFLVLIISLALFGGGWWLSQQEMAGSLRSTSESIVPSAVPSPTASPEKRGSFGQLLDSFLPTDQPTSLPTLAPIPSQRELTGGTHAFQTFNNCGPASLSMALSHYGISVSQQTLGRELRPYQNSAGDNDDKSVTLDEVAQKAEEYGFTVYHRPAGNIELVKQFVAHDMPVLARTWLTPDEDIGHFRLVRGYDEQTGEVIQDDSLQGEGLRYTYADFEEIWRPFNYEFLVLVPEDRKDEATIILGELLNEKVAWQKSLVLAEEALSENPNDEYAAFNVAAARYQLGDYSGSIQAYESVADQLPMRMLWYQIEPILAYWKAGRDEQALQIISRVLNNNNRAFSELYFIRGSIYEAQGNQSAAQEAFNQAELYNPTGSWRVNVE